MSKRELTMLGAAALVAAVVSFVIGAATATSEFTGDVGEEALAVIDAPRSAVLGDGTYQWWVTVDLDGPDQAAIDEYMGDVELRVEDSRGRLLPSTRADWQGSFGSFGEFSPVAFIEIPTTEEYFVDTDGRRTFYLTEPLSAGGTTAAFAAAIVAGLVFGGLGAALLIVGLTRNDARRPGERSA